MWNIETSFMHFYFGTSLCSGHWMCQLQSSSTHTPQRNGLSNLEYFTFLTDSSHPVSLNQRTPFHNASWFVRLCQVPAQVACLHGGAWLRRDPLREIKFSSRVVEAILFLAIALLRRAVHLIFPPHVTKRALLSVRPPCLFNASSAASG